MADLFNYIKPKARLDKNGFDNSHRSVFSCKAGAIYPILTYDMVPNDFVEINVNDLLRTSPLETAAFARMKQNFEFYFVPYVQLWHNFNEMIAQRRDPVTTNSKSSEWTPTVPLKKLVKMALKRLNNQNNIVNSDFISAGIYVQDDIHGYNWGYNVIRLLDLLGYGNFLPLWNYIKSVDEDGDGIPWESIDNIVDNAVSSSDGDELYVNLWPFLAYQKIWSDFYRNPWRDIDINEYAFNVDDIPCDSVENSDVISYRTSQANLGDDGLTPDKVGMFGDIFAQRYKTWKKDIFSASLPNAQFGDVATVQITNISIDSPEADEDNNGSNGDDILFNPEDFRVRIPASELAHYHSVLSDKFTARSESLVTRGAVSSDNNPYPDDTSFYLNYYLGGVDENNEPYPSGSTAYLFTDKALYASDRFGKIESLNRSSTSSVSRRRALNNLVVSTAQDIAAFSVYDLKRAEMLQRWSETTMRSGYRTRSLFEGHFGVSPRYDMDNHPAFLGSFDSVIQINEVTATSESDGIKLGEMAAKGVSVQNGHIRYQSNDYGVLMCMFYIQPEVEYNSFGLDKQRMKVQPFDYFTPEFEDLGFEPVTGGQLNIIAGFSNLANLPVSAPAANRPDLVNQVVGYSPRYSEYKTSYDRVHGLFSETVVQQFVQSDGITLPTPDKVLSVLGEFSHWVSAHETAQYSLFENLKDFYIDPNVLDNIFAIAADNSQSTDQFLVNCYFDIKAVRPMSVLGLPNW